MRELHISQRIVPASDVDYTAEAELVQERAAGNEASVIRLGPIVFFSCRSGDAWMIDVLDGEAACLAQAGEARPIPIVETPFKFGIAWPARHRLENEAFVVIENDGSTRTYNDYPMAEIRRMIADYPGEFASVRAGESKAARERLRSTGRNEPCPCGSGRKYKKCCLTLDEASLTEASRMVQRADLHRAFPSSVADSVDPGDEDEFADPGDDAASSAPASGDTTPEIEEPELAPEVRAAADRIWREFERIKSPGSGELDALVDQLLALPPEATRWADVFRVLVEERHPDLAAAFRRIAVVLPPTKSAGAVYFYWAAMETFVSRGRFDLVPEITSGFRRLDRASYDPDALMDVVLWAMAADRDAEALALEEHFLPILRGDGLMPYAVPSACRSIFDLRVGLRLRELGAAHGDVEALTHELHHDLGDEIRIDYARFAAQFIRGKVSSSEFRRADFNLTSATDADETPDDSSIPESSRRHFELLMRIAHGAWQSRGRAPGSAFHGLALLADAVFEEREDHRGRKGSAPQNLLDCLRPSGMERRIARAARDVLGTHTPRAHLLIEAHADALDFARRHRLIAEDEAEKSGLNLAMLRKKLGFGAASKDEGV